MSNVVISVENLSKTYRLGQIGTGTLSRDINAWWAKLCGKPNPMLKIGQTYHGNRDGGELWALRDVSFTLEQGEVLGIIGHNGAGKSTLLKILSRVTSPSLGRIRVKGRIASLLEVGTGFHPDLTGRENIYLNGAILGMTRKEVNRKFDEIVDFAEVEKFVNTPVKRYSSGMYVRLAFAVAAHLEPEILLVDEVLAVGDVEFQKKCLGKMGDVAKGGRTVIFVSHNMAAIAALCTKSIWLNKGQLECLGTTPEIIERYLRHSSVPCTITLNKREDRTGDGLFRFTEMRIENMKGEILSVVSSGKDIKLILGYETKEFKITNHVKAGVMIYNQSGEFIFMLKSELTNGILNNLPGKGCLICEIPQFPLAPGQYNLNLWAKIGNSWSDKIDNGGTIHVVEGDFYGTGKLPVNRDGILVKHSWKVR